MSGADDLRTAIADLVREFPGFVHGEAYAEDITDAIIEKVLADPVRRLVLLDAMGLDVVRFDVNSNGFPVVVLPLDAEKAGGTETVYEVRPRGDAS